MIDYVSAAKLVASKSLWRTLAASVFFTLFVWGCTPISPKYEWSIAVEANDEAHAELAAELRSIAQEFEFKDFGSGTTSTYFGKDGPYWSFARRKENLWLQIDDYVGESEIRVTLEEDFAKNDSPLLHEIFATLNARLSAKYGDRLGKAVFSRGGWDNIRARS